MNVDDIHDVVAVLLRRLEPVERAELLSDTIEGLHPLARKAAVLIGFFERDGEPTLIFRSEEHTSELQSQSKLVCRLLLEKKKISYFLIVNHDRMFSVTALVTAQVFTPYLERYD